MPSSQRQKDVCDLLDADHKAVKKMFKEFESLCESRARSAARQRLDLAREICIELTVHAQVEEETSPRRREVHRRSSAGISLSDNPSRRPHCGTTEGAIWRCPTSTPMVPFGDDLGKHCCWVRLVREIPHFLGVFIRHA